MNSADSPTSVTWADSVRYRRCLAIMGDTSRHQPQNRTASRSNTHSLMRFALPGPALSGIRGDRWHRAEAAADSVWYTPADHLDTASTHRNSHSHSGLLPAPSITDSGNSSTPSRLLDEHHWRPHMRICRPRQGPSATPSQRTALRLHAHHCDTSLSATRPLALPKSSTRRSELHRVPHADDCRAQGTPSIPTSALWLTLSPPRTLRSRPATSRHWSPRRFAHPGASLGHELHDIGPRTASRSPQGQGAGAGSPRRRSRPAGATRCAGPSRLSRQRQGTVASQSIGSHNFHRSHPRSARRDNGSETRGNSNPDTRASFTRKARVRLAA